MKKIFATIVFILTMGLVYSQSVIDFQLFNEMNKRGNDEKIKVVILMQEQSDQKALSREADKFSTREERRVFVVETLKRQAEASQTGLLGLLEEMKQNDLVDGIQPLWIVNAVSCYATKNAINAIAQCRGIMTIYFCEQTKWISDYESVPVQKLRNREITENLVKVGAPQVWELGYTGEDILIAVLDTGVSFSHVDLAGRFWDGGTEYPNHGYNFSNNNNDPSDDNGHGTHVAGILCGTGASGLQTGIAPDAKIMVLKVFYTDGTGDEPMWSAGMQFALEHGADVMNMSLGRPKPNAAQKLMMRRACENTLAAGVVAVVSAGNVRQIQSITPVPNNITTPADCPPPYLHDDQMVNAGGTSCVIAVGAVDHDDNLGIFSSEGPSQWTDVPEYGDYPYTAGSTTEIGLIRPDICAQGVDVKSLDYNTTDGYTLMSGTSFAAPLVTGTIALMLSKNKELTPAQIDEILEKTAVKFTEHKSNDFGSGHLDALAAVNAIDNDEIEENDAQVQTFVYPNPSSGNFTVRCDDMRQIEVFSADGRLVQNIRTENDIHQIKNLENGIYLLQITTNDSKFQQKIVKF